MEYLGLGGRLGLQWCRLGRSQGGCPRTSLEARKEEEEKRERKKKRKEEK